VPEADASDGVAAMMDRLKLTAKEAKVFVLDDSSQDVFIGPEWALMGKVMAPNTLHVDTIKVVLKAAWGNPKGMFVRSMVPNLFLAEFESEADKRGVINGSPWLLGKNTILLKEFDPRIQPTDVIFDRLLMWVWIYGLPFPLMNKERGTPLASNIGEVVQVEVDEKGRAWGEYLRVQINVDISEPLMRCLAVESASLKKTVYFDVRYEKPPMYRFSCGLIGHSSLVCPTPASRDVDGKLPWCSERVCVPEQWKKDQRSSSGQGSLSGQGSSNQPSASAKKDGEVSSRVKPRKARARKTNVPAKEQDNTGGNHPGGRKRKHVYVAKTSTALAIMNTTTIVAQQKDDVGLLASVEVETEERSGDSNKKQKSDSGIVPDRSVDLAAAVEQPRDTQ
jgi:hypothetical protein